MSADAMERSTLTPAIDLPHVCVCICTFKRPLPLRRLLGELADQATDGLFTYSIVVADNDNAESARQGIEEFRASSSVPILYCVEPQRGIAYARNRVLSNAVGDYFALIDDDEVPIREWLLWLFTQCNRFGVDGVLGPVKNHYDQQPPRWLLECSLCDRKIQPTGTLVRWPEARTGNVLLRAAVVQNDKAPFRVEFTAGEDQDFFRRKIASGCSFIWSAEAVAYEVVPPTRWQRSYYLKRALLNGEMSSMMSPASVKSAVKSLLAVSLYLVMLPLALLRGQHRMMDVLIRLGFHIGRLLAMVNLRFSVSDMCVI